MAIRSVPTQPCHISTLRQIECSLNLFAEHLRRLAADCARLTEPPMRRARSRRAVIRAIYQGGEKEVRHGL